MALAIFDLDNTLIAGDSDYLWGQFIVEQGLVDAASFQKGNDHFYQQYKSGTMILDEYLDFCLEPLTHYSLKELQVYHQTFMAEVINPIMLTSAKALLKKHRDHGDHLMIITASNHFITEPIARELGVDTLLAIDLEIKDDRYTGKTVGIHSYQAGKVTRLNEWLSENTEHSLAGSYFYSDSHNDLPLLKKAEYPFAVDADPTLREFAQKNNWPCISLR